MSQLNYTKIYQKVLTPLTQRQKEVMERRFGLGNAGKRETLEAIGRDFGVTRERVRQIEVESFSRLKRQTKEREVKRVFFYFEEHLKNYGGLKREDLLLENLGKNQYQNYVYFFLTLGDPFHRFPEDNEFYPFWAIEKNIFGRAKEIVNSLFDRFEKEKKPLPESHLKEIVKNQPPQLFQSCLEITKKIEKGPLGEFGLVFWPEIKPRGVKDRAYLVLRRIGKPLHFREIAKACEGLEGKFFQRNQVLPQTVHNELIRDERFVLVGRGIYALKEWGYEMGTVKDIILKILREKPLSKEEILKKVLSQRLVKENTILLNLADKNYFLKDKEGRYILKKA